MARAATVSFVLWTAALSAGCAKIGVANDPGKFESAAAIEVFDAGFGYIQDIYIDTADIGELVLIGLNGLRHIEPALATVKSDADDEVALLIDGRAAAQTKLGHGAAQWASAVVHLIESGRTASAALNAATAESIYASIFDTMADQLDSYTRYLTAEAAREERAKRDGFGGIGASIEKHTDGALISKIKPGQPANIAGLMKGDRILAIDDFAISGMPLRRIVNLLRGPVRTKLILTIRRDAREEPLKVPMTRTHIVEQTVFMKVDRDFAYIRLTGFNQDTLREMRDVTDQAEVTLGARLRGLIIDVRGNPGGLLDQAVKVADLFLATGAILRTRGRHPRSYQYFDADSYVIVPKIPIAVLLDGASASAAEIIASALQDQGRAIVVGASSFGKGTVQQVLRLPNDGELILTWARMHAPSGYVLNRYGVLPTICTSRMRDSATAIAALITGKGESIRRNLKIRRRAGTDDADRPKQMCPWRPHEGQDLDLQIAEGVLGKRELYEKVLAFAKPLTGS